MRQETTIRTLGKFNEFNEEDQKKILENFKTDDDFEFQAESTIEHYTIALSILGFKNVEIAYSGFWSQGDGASFTARFSIPDNDEQVKDRIKNLRQEFGDAFNIHGYEDMSFDNDEWSEGEIKVYRIPSLLPSNTITCDNEDLKEFARSISEDIYRALERDYEYVCSDEYKRDCIEANDYEFYTDTLKLI